MSSTVSNSSMHRVQSGPASMKRVRPTQYGDVATPAFGSSTKRVLHIDDAVGYVTVNANPRLVSATETWLDR